MLHAQYDNYNYEYTNNYPDNGYPDQYEYHYGTTYEDNGDPDYYNNYENNYEVITDTPVVVNPTNAYPTNNPSGCNKVIINWYVQKQPTLRTPQTIRNRKIYGTPQIPWNTFFGNFYQQRYPVPRAPVAPIPPIRYVSPQRRAIEGIIRYYWRI